eukprot:1769435-Pleurochrysis_carterae.AAC.1
MQTMRVDGGNVVSKQLASTIVTKCGKSAASNSTKSSLPSRPAPVSTSILPRGLLSIAAPSRSMMRTRIPGSGITSRMA